MATLKVLDLKIWETVVDEKGNLAKVLRVDTQGYSRGATIQYTEVKQGEDGIVVGQRRYIPADYKGLSRDGKPIQ
jgi:hypothetical protein